MTDISNTDAPDVAQSPSQPPDVLIGAGGDPLALGATAFMLGALTTGIAFVGVFPPDVAGVIVPIAIFTSGVALVITAFWGLLRGQTLLTEIFGVVAGFFISFGVFLLGLFHGWFAIAPADIPSAEAVFFIVFGCWFLTLLMPSLKLPAMFTITISIVIVGLGLGAAGELAPSATLVKIAGGFFLAIAFCLIVFVSSSNTAAVGMKPWPSLGKPLKP